MTVAALSSARPSNSSSTEIRPMRNRRSFSVAPIIFPNLSVSSSLLSVALNWICSMRFEISRAVFGSRSDLIGVTWTIYGYSLAFGDGGSMTPWIGGFAKAFMHGVDASSTAPLTSNARPTAPARREPRTIPRSTASHGPLYRPRTP